MVSIPKKKSSEVASTSVDFSHHSSVKKMKSSEVYSRMFLAERSSASKSIPPETASEEKEKNPPPPREFSCIMVTRKDLPSPLPTKMLDSFSKMNPISTQPCSSASLKFPISPSDSEFCPTDTKFTDLPVEESFGGGRIGQDKFHRPTDVLDIFSKVNPISSQPCSSTSSKRPTNSFNFESPTVDPKSNRTEDKSIVDESSGHHQFYGHKLRRKIVLCIEDDK